MRISPDVIAFEYQTTGRSIRTLARDHKTGVKQIRKALLAAGIDPYKPKPKAYRCRGCGRLYKHQTCAVCHRADCVPVGELRKLAASGPAIQEYSTSYSARGVLWKVT